jgi:phenylpropionate dioxygenase-like ring-hydroxylating dioxygenase large terminal subunit
MISNQWYAILDSREIKKGRPTGVTRLGEKLALWRDQAGRVHCVADPCCHRGAAISGGIVCADHVCCPFHGFEYDGSGKVVRIPANGRSTPVPDRYRVNAWQVREEHGFIWLWTGGLTDAAPEIPFFQEIDSRFSYGGFAEVWPVHYTRAIENQLDVVHLPFVHGNSIGRGNRTLVNGPVVTWEQNRMTFYVDNQQDDGQTSPLRADQIIDYQSLFHLQLQMPNLWQNIISDSLRIVAAFAPIDDSHTKIYLRFYQSFIKVPGLKQAVNALSRVSNRYILHQDRRVVVTQRPVRTDLHMAEKLIQGDAPIIEFRKRRAELLRDVGSDSLPAEK